jgi:hypothetical protein
MIVIRRILVGMAVDCSLKHFLVAVVMGVVKLLVNCYSQYTTAARTPQERAEHNNDIEIPSHDNRVSHTTGNPATAARLPWSVVLRLFLPSDNGGTVTQARGHQAELPRRHHERPRSTAQHEPTLINPDHRVTCVDER